MRTVWKLSSCNCRGHWDWHRQAAHGACAAGMEVPRTWHCCSVLHKYLGYERRKQGQNEWRGLLCSAGTRKALGSINEMCRLVGRRTGSSALILVSQACNRRQEMVITAVCTQGFAQQGHLRSLHSKICCSTFSNTTTRAKVQEPAVSVNRALINIPLFSLETSLSLLLLSS